MFTKLLKYDLKAVLKYWWIAALSSVFLAFFGGGCLRTVQMADSELSGFHIFAILGMILSFVGLFLFIALSEILIFVRFYKNFFSDEGYLTFTLPVKKSSLLNSKILSAFILNLLSFIVFYIDMIILITVGAGEELFTPEFFKGLGELIYSFLHETPLFNFALLAEIFAIIIIASAVQMLGIFICITIAAVIAKKHKVLAAIGIYYVASGAVGFIMQLLFIPNFFFMSSSGDIPLTRVIDLITELPDTLGMITALIAVFAVLAVALLVFALLWLFEYYLLDRKLNLE